MNLSMRGELAAAYTSGSQRARVVTESWGEHNLYCPNCSSPKLGRLSHNTQASDFSCPKCEFWFQLKGQKSRIGNSITDGAYDSMMRAIQRNEAPSYYFMHYDAASWTVKNLLLVPHFAFPPSAIIKRPPLSSTARRAGWVGCNFALNRIPVDARIEIVRTVGQASRLPVEAASSRVTVSAGPAFSHASDFAQDARRTGRRDAFPTIITSPDEVREKFRRIKPLKDLAATQRGWTLDVLNIVRRITSRSSGREPAHSNFSQSLDSFGTATTEFTNSDIYTFERELSALHPDNRHIRDKIRQQLQVLRDTGFFIQPERGVWRVV